MAFLGENRGAGLRGHKPQFFFSKLQRKISGCVRGLGPQFHDLVIEFQGLKLTTPIKKTTVDKLLSKNCKTWIFKCCQLQGLCPLTPGHDLFRLHERTAPSPSVDSWTALIIMGPCPRFYRLEQPLLQLWLALYRWGSAVSRASFGGGMSACCSAGLVCCM